MATKEILPDLKKKLQQTFATLKECSKVIKELESSSKTRLKSVVNLTEQLQSCLRVSNIDLQILKDFPDVQEKLVFKLTREITQDLQNLKATEAQLADCSEKLTRHFNQCLSKFDKVNNQENLPVLAQKTALCPSLSEMLEMVQWSDRRIRESYHCKKYIIEEFSPQQYEDMDELQKAWFSGDAQMLAQIDDYLTISTYFLEEKIT